MVLKEVPLYLSAADLIINKYGGTSVTEMINKACQTSAAEHHHYGKHAVPQTECFAGFAFVRFLTADTVLPQSGCAEFTTVFMKSTAVKTL